MKSTMPMKRRRCIVNAPLRGTEAPSRDGASDVMLESVGSNASLQGVTTKCVAQKRLTVGIWFRDAVDREGGGRVRGS